MVKCCGPFLFMLMKKIIYWVGIYAICATASDYVEELMNGLGRRLHRWSVDEKKTETKRNKSVNISEGKVGEPINRIGF